MSEVLVLTGPTGIGKSQVAMLLGERADCSIVSVDSVQVYRRLDIGTAKPSLADRERVPHYLIDICEPSQIYSAEVFCTDAVAAVERIRREGRIPVLVGGTMMYLRALIQGLARLPSADPQLRQDLSERAEQQGWSALHAELRRRDPEIAERIAPRDSQRIQRALEVIELTGQRLSDLHRRRYQSQFLAKVVALVPHDRQDLYQGLHRRTEQMFAAGFIEEVEALREHYEVDMRLPAWRAVGYRQILDGLQAGTTQQQILEAVNRATKRLVRHQLTWIRKWPELDVRSVQYPMKMRPVSQNEHRLVSQLLQLAE